MKHRRAPYLAALLALTLVGLPSDALPTLKDRAIALIAPVAKRDGFRLHSARCWPWKSGGSVCELCYSHPQHYLGWARVWCGKSRCDWILGDEDPRMRGTKFGEDCFPR